MVGEKGRLKSLFARTYNILMAEGRNLAAALII